MARRLAPAIGLPLLSLDVVKEVLFTTLGVRDRAWSLQVRATSAAVIWSVLPDCPRGAVIDIWADPTRDPEAVRAGLAQAGAGPMREILCVVPGEVAVRRYATRERHPGHLPPDDATLTRIREAAALMAPLGVGPTMRVDTTREVNLDEVVSWLRQH